MLKSALEIYNHLLEKGEINVKDESELYLDFKKEEVRDILHQFEEELKFKLVEAGNHIYMIPEMNNDTLGYVMKDFREGIAMNASMTEAYLQTYICMMIFQMFYGGKNTNPIQREFIATKDLIEELNNKMSSYLNDKERISDLEEEYVINFSRISELWDSKQLGDNTTRKSKIGTICKAYSQLEKEKLIRNFDNKEIRRTTRMDNLFIYYYLDERRVQEIHKIFE